MYSRHVLVTSVDNDDYNTSDNNNEDYIIIMYRRYIVHRGEMMVIKSDAAPVTINQPD